MAHSKDDQFSPDETKRRMEAALRGSRITGHKPMSDLTKKRPKKKDAGVSEPRRKS